MRKIIVAAMISLDGVMQAPGAPDEDTSGGFEYGGWVAPYDDEVYGKAMQKQMQPTDLLLGRKTFEIFENYWPQRAHIWPGINDVTKYALSTSRHKSDWQNTVFLQSVADIQKLKNTTGSDLKVWGSSELVHLLLNNDLIDELWLKIHPLTLGKGKKLFDGGAIPAAFTVTESYVTTKGVFIANYQKAGKVQTGTIGG